MESSSSPILNMDFNSTTPMEPTVIEAVHEACKNLWTNPSSGYATGRHVKEMIENSRQQIAKMINCEADEIVFTSGGTETNNWIIQSFIEYYKTETDRESLVPHIITSNIEHDSVRLILEKLKMDRKVEVTFLDASKEYGFVSLHDVLIAIQPHTVLISVMLANNETGIMQPIAKIGELMETLNKRRWKEIYFHTDASQAVGKTQIDVKKLGVDYLTITGHKFYGPRIGALYRKRGAPLHPIFFGGGQENGLRPGTENTPMIIGLGVAAQLVSDNIDQYERHLDSLRHYMEMKLTNSFGPLVTINGQHSSRLPNTISVTFNDPTMKGTAILGQCPSLLASVGAACHYGQLQPSAVLIASGVDRPMCTIRLSLGRESTESDVDIAVRELEAAVQSIRNEPCEL